MTDDVFDKGRCFGAVSLALTLVADDRIRE